MKQHQCLPEEFTPELEEIYRAMGYGSAQPRAEVRDAVLLQLDEVRAICRPQYLYLVCEGESLGAGGLRIQDMFFTPGSIIMRQLRGISSFGVFVTTVGEELNEYKYKLKGRNNLLDEFVVDTISNAIAETCVTLVRHALECSLNTRTTLSYSPGYCNWELSEQVKLFSLLPPCPCGISLSADCLMQPIKSISGVIGLGNNIITNSYACGVCKQANCYKR